MLNPAGGHWYRFWRRTLLPGAPAAPLHYNASSLIAEAVASKIFGLTFFDYFGDLGSLLPVSMARMGLRTFRRFSDIIRPAIKDVQTKVGRMAEFLALEGRFPDRSGGMLLAVDITDGK